MVGRRNRRLAAWCLATVLTLLVAGCGGEAADESGDPQPGKAAVAQTEPAAVQETKDEPKEELPQFDEETLKNDSGKTMIKLLTKNTSTAHHATYAIVSSKGTVIVADPNEVPNDKGTIKADIITVSHGHPDHSDFSFIAAHQKEGSARISVSKAETFTVNDVKVTGIPASHGSVFDPKVPSDYIYLFEVDGLRIAHFGDMAQEELTQEQLEALGHLDISMSVYSNASQYGFDPKKTVAALNQLKPSIVMPTHYEPETADAVLNELDIQVREESDVLLITKEEIDSQKSWRYILLK